LSAFTNPDPPMKQTLLECLHDINEWPHYDNFQHGHYVNENEVGYGPIRVFNARVHIIAENQAPTKQEGE